jgi:hypothetical protein
MRLLHWLVWAAAAVADVVDISEVIEDCAYQVVSTDRVNVKRSGGGRVDLGGGGGETANTVVVVTMLPGDGDGLTGEDAEESGRQRNEISMNLPELVIQPNKDKNCAFTAQIRMMFDPGDYWPDNRFFYFAQLKSRNVRDPLFAVGVRERRLEISGCGDYQRSFGRLSANDALRVRVGLVGDDRLRFRVVHDTQVGDGGGDTYTGTIKDCNLSDKRIFFKIGQYRRYPNSLIDSDVGRDAGRGQTITTVAYSDLKLLCDD